MAAESAAWQDGVDVGGVLTALLLFEVFEVGAGDRFISNGNV